MKKFRSHLPTLIIVGTVFGFSLLAQDVARAGLALPAADPNISVATDETANKAVADFLNRIVTLIFFAAIPVAVYAIFVTAANLLRAPGDPSGYAKVKKNLISIIIGFVLLTSGSIAVRFVISLLAP